MNLAKVPKPKKGYIVVKLLNEEEKTSGGIIVPDTVKEMNFFTKAQVVAVGSDRDNYKIETKVGDKVLVKKGLIEMTDYTVKVLGESLFLINEESGFYGWIQ